MSTTQAETTPWVYAYPVILNLEEELDEFFITFDEASLYVEPYDTPWIKLGATIIYLIGLWGSYIQYSFIINEVNGYAASFRTAINQLVRAAY